MVKTALSVVIPEVLGDLRDYRSLRKAVTETLVNGQRAIEAARVEIYWKAGKLISGYLEGHPDETWHGRGIIDRLSADLQLEFTLLYRLVRFADLFPNFATSQNLTWSHYRELLAVADHGKRKVLAREAHEKQWPVRRLKREILKQKRETKKGAVHPSGTLVEPEWIEPGVMRVIQLESGRTVVDLGFEVYRDLSASEGKRLKAEEFVRWNSEHLRLDGASAFGDGSGNPSSSGGKSDLYFFEGELERVVDGDTLRVTVDLGFGTRARQYLRLRGLNTAEMGTVDGQKAREFVVNLFRKSRHLRPDGASAFGDGLGKPSSSGGSSSKLLRFRSRFRDPYDRYISDVWVGEVYLNQVLLDKGLAVRV